MKLQELAETEKAKITWKKVVLLIVFPLLFFFISLFLGRLFIDPLSVLKILAKNLLYFPVEQTWSDTAETVVMRVRMPRAIMAGMVGAGLSISGAAFQGMFHNPLVSPFILGVSAGAGFGAALAIVMDGTMLMIQVSAFFFGILAVTITYYLSRIYKTTPILVLVLSGIVISALFQSLLALQYTADTEDKLPAIVFWLMGSMGGVRLEDLPVPLILIAAGSGGLLLIRWRLNILSMGDQEARSLGINTELLKGVIIICSTVIAAMVVAFCGIIGWVGLVIPHLCRMLVGPDHRVLLPTTLSVGAYLILIDNLARIISPAEYPLAFLHHW